jgi:hypothetical protein
MQIAGRHRVLRLEQLVDAGLSRKAVRHRLEQGRLQRLWPAVFLVGPAPPDPLSLAYGATRAFSAAAYVCHDWGTFVHRFAPVPGLPVDILVPVGSRFRRDGIRTHRSWLAAKGWSILPVTDEMLRHQPFAVVAKITEALTRRDVTA